MLLLSNHFSRSGRICKGDAEYEPLREKIRNRLTPAILGWAPTAEEHNLLAMPVKLGGLAIENPVSSFNSRYNTSRRAISVIADSISTGSEFSAEAHSEQVIREQKEGEELDAEKSRQVMEQLEPATRRTLKRVVGRNASQWLTKIPLVADSLDLSPTQFRDALCRNYNKPLLTMRGKYIT
ncbi:hypothetical protein GE061_017437 [Apolygus lucorum]|uniref:Uncharacterized protein n=1 Tax=Apolygus lucorum TaxID=248454 RepID=A0A8S9XD56_APOLU|nr:hypothetical protein GE061_017437 [Apolygus lucorum]